MSGGIARGLIPYREDITEGLENAPKAFVDMLEGRNFGIALVQRSATRLSVRVTSGTVWVEPEDPRPARWDDSAAPRSPRFSLREMPFDEEVGCSS